MFCPNCSQLLDDSHLNSVDLYECPRCHINAAIHIIYRPAYYKILGGYSGEVIGMTTEVMDVIPEEPNASFEVATQQDWDNFNLD
jgi:hypothetical protein